MEGGILLPLYRYRFIRLDFETINSVVVLDYTIIILGGKIMGWFRFLIGAACILAGLTVSCIAVFGTWKFKYVLNRMHAAALNDTLGIFFVILGLVVLNGLNFTSLKLFVIVCFLWMASPVASHLLARLEVTLDKEQIGQECEVDEDVLL